MNVQQSSMVNDTNTNNAMSDNNKLSNGVNGNINKNDEEKANLNLFTPYSTSNTITTNARFLYGSDTELSFKCHGSLSSLHIEPDIIEPNQYSDDTDYDNDNDYDYDDYDEEYHYVDDDDIPLIDRITPPPPLYINNNTDNEYYDEDEYEIYHSDNDQNDDKNDGNNFDKDKSCKSFLSLSIKIPSLQTSKSSPIREKKLKCSIFENYNQITPISSDNEYDYNQFVKHKSVETNNINNG